MRYIFIGEEKSELAKQRNLRWEDGALAAKQLFDALRDNNIDPVNQLYFNLLDGSISIFALSLLERDGYKLVGMGKKVQAELDKHKLEHIKIVHPAARGKIRKKENYSKHIGDQLNG